MNPFDVFILIVLVYCVIMGFFRGLVREIASLAGVIFGIFAAYSYYGTAAEYLSQWVFEPAYAKVLGFALVLFGVIFFVGIIGLIIKLMFEIVFGEWFERACGAAFGALKAILISGIILIPLTTFLPPSSHLIEESVLSPRISLLSEKIIRLAPYEMKHEFIGRIEAMRNRWEASD